MYFVLDTITNKTVAMTAFKDAAEIIAASFSATPPKLLAATQRTACSLRMNRK